MPKELAKVTPEQIKLAYRAILDGDVLPEIGDPELISRAIMERIMHADTFEEVFAPQALTAWRDLLDVPVFVKDVRLNRSTLEGGASVYAVVDIARADGANWETGEEGGSEFLTVSCGGKNVLIQLVKMLEKGWLDRAVRLTKRRTAEGYDVLWLEAA